MMIDHNNLIARRAEFTDLPKLTELLVDDTLGKQRENIKEDFNHYLRAFKEIDADQNQYLMVAEFEHQVVGMLQLTFIPGLSHRGATRANIESVRVDRNLRGEGIGNWMIATALRIARERGCQIAQLTSDKTRKEAHRFYSRLGFVATHEGFKLKL